MSSGSPPGADAAAVTLLVPALDEIEGMRAIAPRIRREWVDQILVVDGGSRDGTPDFARSLGWEVHVQRERGLRQGYLEAWPLVRGDVVITFSPDGNSVPEMIPPLVRKMREGYDMVIVSRYARGARSEDDDPVTRLGNWMFTQLINALHGGRYTDAFVMFRAYRKALIAELGLDREEAYAVPERLFRTRVSWEPLLSVRAARARKRCADIPGDEPPRIGGERKLQIVRWGAAYLYQVLGEAFR